MPQAKKFGAFAGVFTPSILTILGVIMYMRLGWVVGEAGLIATLGIIFIAHIISVSTGLSISSIATDKKIKTGGLYYMLSRSLGLPMGGSIGITLFIGTAMSIALYIVGFCENFLGIQVISNFLGMEPTINNIRIVGTIVIIGLVIIAFISTSLAIKTQFIILGAIALSLISIFVGFFINPGIHPEQVSMLPTTHEIPLIVVFAIFFPAVTGFTAGVAMSGDLKDPKKAIPIGTMGAIFIGLIIYVVLAISLAFFVDRDLLLNDSNFLMRIAWFSPLVVAGIWGATLSSALGGILGGPRILQAISNDKITPKFLGKGYGKNNEPRNALIVTFILAEIGILVGELNAIAEIVTMFYIAAYGFINLAYALEKWASSDFRPSLKISKWIGIVGFVACFAIMFQMNALVMVGAFVIMWGIYFILKKRELQLDFGDVWQSVYSSIVRTSLNRMDKKELEERNWRPNIILFSGGTKNRQHLISFGKNLVGMHGFLSNFELIENKDEKITMPKHEQKSTSEESEQYKGIFTRRQTCSNIYDGIESISQSYGFSGIEPNLIFLGWGRQSKNPVRFAQTINALSNLDLNIMMMDYDKRDGFGEKKLVDIWWRGSGNNGNLALTLMKFLWLSEEWRDANARLLIVNPDNEERDNIYRDAQSVLDNLRINAEIKIINNQIEKKSFYEIIRTESINSDVIFMGIPDIEQGKEKEFVDETNKLCKDIGTVIIIKASSRFKDLKIGIKAKPVLKQTDDLRGIDLIISEKIEIDEISLPEKNIVANQVKLLHENLNKLIGDYNQNYLSKIFRFHDILITSLKENVFQNFKTIESKICNNPDVNQSRLITKIQKNFFTFSIKQINEFQNEAIQEQKFILSDAINKYIAELDNEIISLPKTIINRFDKEDLRIDKNDSASLKWFKFRKRLAIKISGKSVKYKIKYKRIVKSYLPQKLYYSLYKMLDKWGLIAAQFNIETRKLIRKIDESFQTIENNAENNNLSEEIVISEKQNLALYIKEIEDLNKNSFQSLYLFCLDDVAKITQLISDDLKHLDANKFVREDDDETDSKNIKIIKKIKLIPELWRENQRLFYNSSYLELALLAFSSRIKAIFVDISEEINQQIQNNVLEYQEEALKELEKYYKKLKKNQTAKFEYVYDNKKLESINDYSKILIGTILKMIKKTSSVFPETIDVFSEQAYNDFNSGQFSKAETINISVIRFLDYLIQIEFVEPLQKIISELPEKLKLIDDRIHDTFRMISFSIQLNDEDEIIEFAKKEENTKSVIADLQNNFKKEIENTKELRTQTILQINERINTVINKLSYYTFTNTALDMKQYVKEHTKKRTLVKVKDSFGKFNRNINDFFSHLWYNQSKGILLAKRLIIKESANTTKVNDTLNLLQEVSCDKAIINKLPFYYKQLFFRKHQYLNEFWVGREKELLQMKSSIDRYKSGYFGGVLIVGERNSGKTFFAQYVANKFFNNSNVYYVSAPFTGSINPDVFKNTLKNTLEIKGAFNNVFNKLPENSVVVIEDIELWWEKSSSGLDVINLIMEIIEKYGDKCLFIITANIHSFNLINKIKKIKNNFLNIIECGAFNAEQMKDIILLRHQSSGIKFKLKNKSQDRFLSWNYARLFAKYFSYSKGNVGVALQLWMANIIDFNENTISIKSPKIPDISVLDSLETDWLILIVQFVLHRRLTVEKLERIVLQKADVLQKKINVLKRSGLIVENSNNVFEINQFLYFHIVNSLIEKEML